VRAPRRNSSWAIVLCSILLFTGLGLVNLERGEQPADGWLDVAITIADAPGVGAAVIPFSASSSTSIT
jgi:hypothetical protein